VSRSAGVLRFWPGLATAIVLALAATFVADHYGGPQFLYALLFGLAFNFLSEDERTHPGIDLAARTVLRIGVALLGARVTLGQVASLGTAPIAIVVVAVVSTLALGAWLARAMGRPRSEGLLSGGAVAICGASAALAISAVLPRHPKHEQFTLLTVVGVTLLSTLAMVAYPILVLLLKLSDSDAGIFLGGAIHDVAQVVGAGYTVSPAVGDSAVVVKMLRVAMLLPVVIALSVAFRSHAELARRPPLLPWFLVVFAGLVALTSIIEPSPAAVSAVSDISRWCLVTAIAGLGVKTSFREFARLGWRPVAMLVIETLFIAAIVLAMLALRR
jgi:uncharacterized integral membrane protein (TIGR00698 family)